MIQRLVIRKEVLLRIQHSKIFQKTGYVRYAE